MIKKIDLKPNQILTYNDIYRILNEARSTFQYAKFTSANGKYWISATFDRDLSIIIATNCRDMTLYYEYQFVMKIKTLQSVAQLFFKWLPKINKLI